MNGQDPREPWLKWVLPPASESRGLMHDVKRQFAEIGYRGFGPTSDGKRIRLRDFNGEISRKDWGGRYDTSFLIYDCSSYWEYSRGQSPDPHP